MPRKFTDEQFMPGGAIDGDRMDKSQQDLLELFNALGVGDLHTRWVPNHLVIGHQPQVRGTTEAVNAKLNHTTPWLRGINIDAFQIGGLSEFIDQTDDDGGPWQDFAQNYFRAKGTEVQDLVDLGIAFPSTLTQDTQWIWETSYILPVPHIMTGINLVLMVDNTNPFYNNLMLYGAFAGPGSPPDGHSNGDYVDDFAIVVMVDNPFSTEERARADSVLIWWERSFESVLVSNQAILAIADVIDMEPAHPGGVPSGVEIDLMDILIPVPAFARMRIMLVLPTYDAARVEAGWNSNVVVGGATSYDTRYAFGNQAYNLTIHHLEELVA